MLFSERYRASNYLSKTTAKELGKYFGTALGYEMMEEHSDIRMVMTQIGDAEDILATHAKDNLTVENHLRMLRNVRKKIEAKLAKANND